MYILLSFYWSSLSLADVIMSSEPYTHCRLEGHSCVRMHGLGVAIHDHHHLRTPLHIFEPTDVNIWVNGLDMSRFVFVSTTVTILYEKCNAPLCLTTSTCRPDGISLIKVYSASMVQKIGNFSMNTNELNVLHTTTFLTRLSRTNKPSIKLALASVIDGLLFFDETLHMS